LILLLIRFLSEPKAAPITGAAFGFSTQ